MRRWELPPADTYFGPILAKTPAGFELDHLERALAYVRRWRVAVDGGAHVGTWAARLAERFNSVVAYEAAPDTWACCSRNLEAHRNAIAIHAALGAGYGRCAIGDDATRPGNTGARHVVRGTLVEMRSLNSEGFAELDFLKLDLEGYEYFALMGALDTLRRCRPVVVIEDKAGMAERYGCERHWALELLRGLGMVEAERVRNDAIFVWPD